jgi:predicted nucleic acid-binding protein
LAEGELEKERVKDTLAVLKILGVNARSAPRMAEALAVSRDHDKIRSLIAGVCLESRLPLLTGMRKEFEHFPGLVLIHPDTLRVPANNSERA